MFVSLSALPLHSPEQKTMFLEMLGDAFPADSLDINTSFIEPIPDSPPFKREVHYISFKHNFDDDVDVDVNIDADADADADAELLCLRLQHEALIHTTLHIPTITSTPPSLPPPPPQPQVIPNKSTISATDYLLNLINQFPAAPLARPPSPSPFNFSYIAVKNLIPSNDPSSEPRTNPSARPSAAPSFVSRPIPTSVPTTNPRTAPISVPRFDMFSFPSLVDV